MTTVSLSPGTASARVEFAVHDVEGAVIGFLRDHPDTALGDLLRALLRDHAPELLSSAIMGLLGRHVIEMTTSRHLVLNSNAQPA